MTEHTKGPWTIELVGTQPYVRMFVGKVGLPNETGFARFSVQPYTDTKKALANAKLIAAAPDLLEALQFALPIMESLSGFENGVYQCDLMKMRAAIAKAKGGS